MLSRLLQRGHDAQYQAGDRTSQLNVRRGLRDEAQQRLEQLVRHAFVLAHALEALAERHGHDVLPARQHSELGRDDLGVAVALEQRLLQALNVLIANRRVVGLLHQQEAMQRGNVDQVLRVIVAEWLQVQAREGRQVCVELRRLALWKVDGLQQLDDLLTISSFLHRATQSVRALHKCTFLDQ